jgi:methionyl aminopeptidase
MLAEMFREITPLVQPGIETLELDRWAQDWTKKRGGKPACLGVGDRDNPFPAMLCISINDEVIHGIPSHRKVKDGDLVSIDTCIDLGGYISDKSITFEAGNVSPDKKKLNSVTRDCLAAGIAAAKSGVRIHQIARAVQGLARENGYGVVEDYCGHGVGFDMHEDPSVPNVPRGANPRLMQGMVIAIEPMINMGGPDVDLADDGWTVLTSDGKPSAHWENTVAIFSDHTEVLTEL